MRFAFSKPTSNEADTATLFSFFREAGYDALQLKAGQYFPYLKEPERFLKERGTHPGAAQALILWCDLDEEGTAKIRDAFRFGKAVGSEMLVFCHNNPREGVTRDQLRGFAKMLSDLGMEGREFGMKLSLHNHYNQPVMHRPDFDVFFEAVTNRAVGLTVDTAHLVKSGVEDVAGLIRDMAPVIDNFHMKDFADGEFKVLGQGRIDLAPIFEAVRQIGYSGVVSTDEESGAELKTAMLSCLRFMREGLAQAKGVA